MVLVFNRNKKRTSLRNNGNGNTGMEEYQTRIGLLCDIAEEASSITQVSTLLERILKVTQHSTGSLMTSAFMKDDAKDRVHLPITVSNYENEERHKAIAIESEIASLVASNATPLLINNVAADPRFNPKGKKSSSFIVRSIIVVPVLKGEKVIGVLAASNKEDGSDFTERDFEVLKGFASTEALILLVSLEKTAIDNVNSLTVNQTVLDGYRSTVHELASTIDVKDDHVYDHSRRVKEYALLAANYLSLPPQELQAIEFGALLHDIGKIGIDSEILRKPGPLTDEEWNIIYEHPQKGANILKDIPHLKDAMNIVLYHHEKYDGKGYPQKLKGDKIPIGARLVAVANAFDTMITDHSYRAASSIDEAMRELIEGTGTQFCPKAIEAFISAYKKHRVSLPVKENHPEEIKIEKEAEETKSLNLIKADKAVKESKTDKEAKIKAEKEAQEARIKAEKEAREAKIKAEREAKVEAEQQAKEAKIRAEKEAQEAKALKIKAEKEAREAKIKAEQEAKEAKIRTEKEAKEAKIRAEQEAKEAKNLKIKAEKEAQEAKIKTEQEAKIKAEKEAREAKIRAEREAKEDKQAVQEPKAAPAKKDSVISKGNVRLTVPITATAGEVKRFREDLVKIEGVKILMLSHSEEEGHLFLLSLEKPMTLISFIKEMSPVESVDRKGKEILVTLKNTAEASPVTIE